MKTLTSILKECRSVEFNGATYYPVKDILKAIAPYPKEYMITFKDATPLPFDGETLPSVTEEQAPELLERFANRPKDQDELSDFDKKLMQAINYDPKK